MQKDTFFTGGADAAAGGAKDPSMVLLRNPGDEMSVDGVTALEETEPVGECCHDDWFDDAEDDDLDLTTALFSASGIRSAALP